LTGWPGASRASSATPFSSANRAAGRSAAIAAARLGTLAPGGAGATRITRGTSAAASAADRMRKDRNSARIAAGSPPPGGAASRKW